ncbi:AtpZ/AtpI family protein [Egicoccus sp. AB-alg2]|uniref:AtpZ/AtpI family protein n=1 Tax=Egicoccus sp. AB-alg2 TaxID=3242693 RepID=UPI00359E55F9
MDWYGNPVSGANAAGGFGREFRRGSWKGVDEANVMSVELISAILVWAGIGWLLDRWLGTPPWFLVIGALVGNFAGLYLVWLRGTRMNEREQRLRDEAAGRRTKQPDGDAS